MSPTWDGNLDSDSNGTVGSGFFGVGLLLASLPVVGSGEDNKAQRQFPAGGFCGTKWVEGNKQGKLSKIEKLATMFYAALICFHHGEFQSRGRYNPRSSSQHL
jgi:hypothetical protein